jgi:hypothetical protein
MRDVLIKIKNELNMLVSYVLMLDYYFKIFDLIHLYFFTYF